MDQSQKNTSPSASVQLFNIFLFIGAIFGIGSVAFVISFIALYYQNITIVFAIIPIYLAIIYGLFLLLFNAKVPAFVRTTTSVLLTIILILIAISWKFIVD
ncbi:hypothetical protein [Ignatzschineria sp. LJL83]